MRTAAIIVGAIAIATGAPLAGCKSGSQSAVQRTVRATRSLDQVRTELSTVIAQTNTVIDALSGMQEATGALKDPFSGYTRAVSRLSSDIDRARARFRDLDTRANEYIDAWQAEAAEIQSEEIRSVSEQRIASARADFEKVETAGRAAGDLIDPLMTMLLDIQTALSNDLTAGGVNALSNQFTEAALQARQFNRRVAALQTEIDALYAKWQRERPGEEEAGDSEG